MVIGRDDLSCAEFVGGSFADGPTPNHSKVVDEDYYVTGLEFMLYVRGLDGIRTLAPSVCELRKPY